LFRHPEARARLLAREPRAGEGAGRATARAWPLALVGLKAYPATAIAAVDSVALVWPSAAWPRLTARHPGLAANTMQTVGSRLQDTQARVVEMSTEQVERRVAHALLRLAQQAGRKVEEGISPGRGRRWQRVFPPRRGSSLRLIRPRKKVDMPKNHFKIIAWLADTGVRVLIHKAETSFRHGAAAQQRES